MHKMLTQTREHSVLVLKNKTYILRSYITRMVVNLHTKPASGDKIRGKSVTSKRSFQCTKKLKTLAHFQTQIKHHQTKTRCDLCLLWQV